MIPVEAVEAAAKAIYRHTLGLDDWDSRSDVIKETCRVKARAALEAAAPHMQAGAWGDGLQYAYEEGYLTRPQLEALQESNPHRSRHDPR